MTAPKLRKHELRLVRPETAPPPGPPTLYRLQSSQGELRPVVPPAPLAPLQHPRGPWEALERALGRGDAAGARALLGTAPRPAPAQGVPETPAAPEAPAADARTRWARVLVLEGDLPAARALLQEEQGGAEAPGAEAPGAEAPGAEVPGAALAWAEVCWAEGDAKNAHVHAERALAQNPGGIAEHLAMARALLGAGQVQDAARELAHIAASDPEHALCRYHLAEIVAAHGDASRAGTLYEMALASAPGFVPAALSFAELLMSARHYGEAMQVLTQATEHAPDALAPRVLQLRLLLEVQESELALQLAERLREALPAHSEILALWALALSQVGREDEARSTLEAALAENAGEDAAALARALAQMHLSASPPRPTEARILLERALRAAPGDEGLILEVAELQAREGDHEGAGETLLRFLELSAADLNRVFSAAWLAYHLRLHEPARRLGEAVLECVQGTPAEEQVRSFLAQLPAASTGAG